MSDTPRLSLKNITKSYDDARIVDDVSIGLMAGQVTCLLGPSGCGKSTTLRIAAGVEIQDSGEVFQDGDLLSDGRGHVPPEQRSIGLMFQDFALFPHLTVAANVGFGLKGASNRARVTELLERVGMQRHIDKYPHELSGGEQQRVALARALAPKPQIMLMDEPFSGLDDRLRDDIRDETLDVLKAEGTAVLLVTHEPAEAMRMANDIALMRNGRIVQTATPFDIYTAPADLEAARFFSDVNVIEAEVKSGEAHTPFGLFDVSDLADGNTVNIGIRPQDLKIDGDEPDASNECGTAVRAEVFRARYLGSESIIEFRLDHDGSLLSAKVPSAFLPEPSSVFWLSFPRDRTFVFSATS